MTTHKHTFSGVEPVLYCEMIVDGLLIWRVKNIFTNRVLVFLEETMRNNNGEITNTNRKGRNH